MNLFSVEKKIWIFCCVFSLRSTPVSAQEITNDFEVVYSLLDLLKTRVIHRNAFLLCLIWVAQVGWQSEPRGKVIAVLDPSRTPHETGHALLEWMRGWYENAIRWIQGVSAHAESEQSIPYSTAQPRYSAQNFHQKPEELMIKSHTLLRGQKW